MKTKDTLFFIFLLLLASSCGNKQKTFVAPVDKLHPEWAYNSTIYEVNIRQYTPEGTFQAFDKHLPRLKELGVDILWFMPVQTIGEKGRKGSLGSYYSIRNYTEVNPYFGNLEDFKATVGKAHDLGMKVILDWVANHTSHDAVWVTEHPDWYVLDSLGNVTSPYDWSDVAKLNYNNMEMRDAMIESMFFWIRNADVDGFRCDVAGEVPTDFWETAINELKQEKAGLFLLAEAEKPELQKNAFDAFYAWDLHHRMNKIAQGIDNVDSLRSSLTRLNNEFPAGTIPMLFTSNHDENSWKGTEFERMGQATKAMAVLSYTLPGIPLIYNGQEAGFNRRLAFFEKDSIDWTNLDTFTPFYQSLNLLRKTNKALYSPEVGGNYVELSTEFPQDVLAFKREKEENLVIAVFNFSPQERKVTINDGSLSGTFNTLERKQENIDKKIELTLSPWEYKVWYK